MSDLAIQQRIALDLYPQRDDEKRGWLEKTGEVLFTCLYNRFRRSSIHLSGILPVVNQFKSQLSGLTDSELRARADKLHYQLRSRGFEKDLVAQTFALVREISNKQLGMAHYDTQIMGGWAIFNGMVAEMETGEGKTLTATLPACTAALAGVPVHIITANDYLAKRDAEWMSPIYKALDLTVGYVVSGMEPGERREAYACDITYCTNKQVAFDHLRDRLILKRHSGQLAMRLTDFNAESQLSEKLLLRGLCFGIVDEADSVLVDEAVTPLIISRPGDTEHKKEVFEQALALALELNSGSDYLVNTRERVVELTESGAERLQKLCAKSVGLWRNTRYREDLVTQALKAENLYQLDQHYILNNGKVDIVDEFTGRAMPDRTWERGLHQMIEVKEGCEITGEQETLGRISYQRFFRRYLKMGGMTGTASEVAGELKSVYRLQVVKIAPHKPVKRFAFPDTLLRKQDEKWSRVVGRVKELIETGRPVLVGTRSVAASEHLGNLLDQAGIANRVLNARQDADEAEIIAKAGQKCQVTVATNMAGRGTDIRPDQDVLELGGLHVIATEKHESGRIDRQLYGRCGRQGDPGSHEAITSLDDELVTRYTPETGQQLIVLLWEYSPKLAKLLGSWLTTYAGKSAEKKYSQARSRLLRSEDYLENVLAFSGLQE